MAEYRAPRRPEWMSPLLSNSGIYFAEFLSSDDCHRQRVMALGGPEKGFLSPVKIGYATDVAARVATLQCGNPDWLWARLVLPLSREYEAYLHDLLGMFRCGGEWFDDEDDEGHLTQFLDVTSYGDVGRVKDWIDWRRGTATILAARTEAFYDWRLLTPEIRAEAQRGFAVNA